MILESVIIVAFALLLDFLVGDPKTKYHPTAWIGKLIASLVPFTKNNSARKELLGGILLVGVIVIVVSTLLVVLDIGISLLTIDIISLVVSIVVGSILLKTTIAIKGMQKHALAVVNAVEEGDLDSARNHLSMIVKRDTKNLDKNQTHNINFRLNYIRQSGLGLSMIGNYGSGFPYTPEDARARPIDKQYSGRMPPTSNVDLKIYYDLKMKDLSIRLFGDISNVMNRANVLAVDNTTGEPDATLDSGQPPMYVWKPYYFSPPRHIEIGISIGH